MSKAVAAAGKDDVRLIASAILGAGSQYRSELLCLSVGQAAQQSALDVLELLRSAQMAAGAALQMAASRRSLFRHRRDVDLLSMRYAALALARKNLAAAADEVDRWQEATRVLAPMLSRDAARLVRGRADVLCVLRSQITAADAGAEESLTNIRAVLTAHHADTALRGGE